MSFTKKDLKEGMVCTMRDGDTYAYLGSVLTSLHRNIADMTRYSDTLTSPRYAGKDIMKITYGGKVVFEREEWRELTIDEAFELLKSDKAVEDCCIQGQGLRDGATVWGGFSISMIAPSHAEPFYSHRVKHGFAKFRIKK